VILARLRAPRHGEAGTQVLSGRAWGGLPAQPV